MCFAFFITIPKTTTKTWSKFKDNAKVWVVWVKLSCWQNAFLGLKYEQKKFAWHENGRKKIEKTLSCLVFFNSVPENGQENSLKSTTTKNAKA